MSYRIDIESLRRYSADGVTRALSAADRQRFEQAIEDALAARERAGGPGELDGAAERVFVVEEGDSLWDIAEELHVDFGELLEFNERDDLPDADEIDAGDVVFVPQTSPEEAANSPRDENGVPLGEDDLIDGLRERGNDLEHADDPAAVDHDQETADLAADIEAYLAALPADERQAALQRIYDNDWVDAGPALMAIEQAAANSGIGLQESQHTGPEAEAAAREILADAQAQDDPHEALRVLEEGYDAASPTVRVALDRASATREIATDAGADIIADAQAEDDPTAALTAYEQGYANAPERAQAALDRSPEVQALIDEAATWAAEPFEGELDGIETPEQRTLVALERLATLTDGLDSELAAEVVDAMIAEIEAANEGELSDYGGVVAGPGGTGHLIDVLDRIADAESGDDIAMRLTEHLSLDLDTVRNAMNESVANDGPIPLLALTVASHDGAEGFRDEVFAAVEQYRDHVLGDQVEAYHEHLEELGYLIEVGAPAMTPEQLEAAIEEYIEQQDPEWVEELESLREQIATSGASLLEQIQQLQGLPEEVREPSRERLDDMLDDPLSQLGISTALQEQPELVRGEAGDDLIETFNELGITGDHPLAATLVAAYLNENLLESAENLDFTDADSMAEARDAITEALDGNPQLAELMEISASELDALAELLSGVIPSEPLPDGENFEQVSSVIRNLNNTLDQIDDKLLGRSAPFSITFRSVAFATSGSGLINAGFNFLEDPALGDIPELGAAATAAGVHLAQLRAAYQNVSDAGTISNLKAASKFVHIMGATMAGADAVSRYQEEDYWGAGLNATVAGGVGMAVLFSSTSWGGPVGFGIATAGAVGLYVYDSTRETPYETQATTDFLTHAGFSEDVAAILTERSESGYNTVPLLMRYGELHGLTSEQTVEWINSIPEGDNGSVMLEALCGNLHNTLEQLDGDVAQFDEHADGFELFGPSLGESRSGSLSPRSKFELDAILPQLDIALPSDFA